MTAREMAEEIAGDLFTNGAGNEAQRLVLELPDKSSGDGWCKQAVVDVIARHLKPQNRAPRICLPRVGKVEEKTR